MYAQIDKQGRLLIPAAIRNDLNYKPDTPLVLRVINNELHVVSIKKALGDIQSLVKKRNISHGSSVDQFIAERRQSAKKEA
ncbi:AbrB/MazE/SpoVT family DNA-binding domain-containing protein [Rickettsiaceae bacterium]|nr:AbrB/MazE/SpoVT family DNA-binding domain-containing protein [Rickettsiaceae bacterium]